MRWRYRLFLWAGRLHRAVAKDPDRVSQRSVVWMELLLRWDRQQRASPDPADPLEVIFINRDRDVDRRKMIESQCAAMGIRAKRYPAVTFDPDNFREQGHIRFVGDSFSGNPQFRTNRICLQLSHAGVWEQVANGDKGWAFCVEDDALFYGRPLMDPQSGAFPEDADFIFCNLRMADCLMRSKSLQTGPVLPLFVPLQAAADQILEYLHQYPAPGLDAYYVSKRGAAKVRSVWETFRISTFADWFIFLNSLEPDYREEWLTRNGHGNLKKLVYPDATINAYVMVPPLVDQSGTNSVADEGSGHVMTREELVALSEGTSRR